MHFAKRILSAALIALASASPGLAQDGSEAATGRTPKGAQDFIVAMAPMAYDYTEARNFYWKVVSSVRVVDACKLEVMATSAFLASDTRTLVAEAAESPKSFIIDWSLVDEIIPQEYKPIDGVEFFQIKFATPRGPYPKGERFYYTNRQTRDRVAAAAQYLRDACDKTKGSGF